MIAWERIPVWRAVPLPQFRTEFATTIRIADRVQPALLLASIVTAIGFGLVANGAARALALVGAAGFIGILAASLAVLVPLQRRIIASSEVSPTLERRCVAGGSWATSGDPRWR